MKIKLCFPLIFFLLTVSFAGHAQTSADFVYDWDFNEKSENISKKYNIYPIDFLHYIEYGENAVTVSNSEIQFPGNDTEAGVKCVMNKGIQPKNTLLHLSFYIESDDTFNNKNAYIRYGRFKSGSIIPEFFDDCIITAASDGNFYSCINDKVTSLPYNAGERYKIDCFADILSGKRKVYVNGTLLAGGTGKSVTVTDEYPQIEIEHIRYSYNIKNKISNVYAVSKMTVSNVRLIMSDKQKGDDYLMNIPLDLTINREESRAELKMFNDEAIPPTLIIASYTPDGQLEEIKTDSTSARLNADGTVDYLSEYMYSENKVKKAFVWNKTTLVPLRARCSTESEFTAKLRIDNKIKFSWSSDIKEGTVSFYTDENKAAIENIPVSQKSVLYDFQGNETEYSDYYTAVFKDSDGSKIESKTAAITAIMPRKTKKLTTLEHPYMLATTDMIDNVRKLSETSPFYKRSIDAITERADFYVNTYSDFAGTIPQNPISNSGPVFEVKNAVTYCAIANLFNPKSEYTETAIRLFKALGDTYEVNDYLMLQNKDDFLIIKPLCEAYDFLYNYLTCEERNDIENRYFRVAAERMLNLERGRTRGGCNADVAIISIAFLLQDQDLYDIGWYDAENGHGLLYQVVNGLGDDSVWWEQSAGYHENKIDHWSELGEYFENAGYDFYNYCFSGTRESEYVGTDVAIRRNDNARSYVNDLKYMNLIDGMIYRAGLNGWLPDFGDAEPDGNLWSPGYITYFERIYRHTHDERIAYLLSIFYGTERGKDNSGSSTIIAHPRVLFAAEPEIKIKTKGFPLKDGFFAHNAYNKFGATVFGDLGEIALRQCGGGLSSELWTQWCGYGTVSHSNADKLSIIWNINGERALADWGTYSYRTTPRYEYAKFTAAHNTVFADDRNQAPYNIADNGGYGEWIADENGEFTGGELNDIAIGPYSRAVSITNNNVYEYLGINMNRIIWQIDDYIIDMFNTDSKRLHEYVYPLNINGSMENISLAMTPESDKQKSYGNVPGTMHIRNLSNSDKTAVGWSSVCNIGDSGKTKMKINMLGGDNTIVTTGFGIEDSNEDIYNKLVLLAKRKKKSTCFVNIMDPGKNDSFRTVLQLAAPENNGQKTYAAEIRSNDGIKDTILCSAHTYDRSVNGYKTDAQSAFFRNVNEVDTIIGCINGTKANGKKISVSSDKPISFQLTQTGDECYRLDMGDKSKAVINIKGLDGYKAYVSKSGSGWLEKDISQLDASKGATYFLAPEINLINDCTSDFIITKLSD